MLKLYQSLVRPKLEYCVLAKVSLPNGGKQFYFACDRFDTIPALDEERDLGVIVSCTKAIKNTYRFPLQVSHGY